MLDWFGWLEWMGLSTSLKLSFLGKLGLPPMPCQIRYPAETYKLVNDLFRIPPQKARGSVSPSGEYTMSSALMEPLEGT